MPFNEPFQTTFSKGDLIYGLASTRDGLVLKFNDPIVRSKAVATVDQYRYSMVKEIIDANEKQIQQMVDDIAMKKLVQSQAKTIALMEQRLNDMRTHKDDRRVEWGVFLAAIKKHPKYKRYHAALKPYDGKEEKFANETAKAGVVNGAWRAKSKFGIQWTVSSGHTIHFVLDSIDMGAVVTKTHRYVDQSGTVLAEDLPRGKFRGNAEAFEDKERTITHSELRWIYRNRKNPSVVGGIQFWDDKVPVHPPWENSVKQTNLPSGSNITWKQAWNMYNPAQEPESFAV